MTRFGQTDGFGLKEHIEEIEKYLGNGTLDYCLFNKMDKVSPKAIKWYKDNDALPVKNNYTGAVKVITKDLVSTAFYKRNSADKLTRSLVRHDSSKLAKAIVQLL